MDECLVDRAWIREQVDVLTMVSRLTSVFLMKKRMHDVRDQWEQSLVTVLEEFPFWVYVIDPDTCEIFFCNSKVQSIVDGMESGVFCYQAVMNSDKRCKNCPAMNIQAHGHGNAKTWNEHLTEASLIKWDGRDAALIVCSVLPDPEQDSKQSCSGTDHTT